MRLLQLLMTFDTCIFDNIYPQVIHIKETGNEFNGV